MALPESLPGGVRVILAENLLAAMLNLEVAAGNDALASHSDMRKTAKLMCQFLPGADFVHSGYSSMPRYDNLWRRLFRRGRFGRLSRPATRHARGRRAAPRP